MERTIYMVRFILTTTCLILIIINTASEAIKFQDDSINKPEKTDETKTSPDFIDDFDDVDGRIMTGDINVRKKKHYFDIDSDDTKIKKVYKNHNGMTDNTPKNELHEYSDAKKLAGGVNNQYAAHNYPASEFINSETFSSTSNEDVSNEDVSNSGFQENTENINSGDFNSEADSSGSVIDQCIRDNSLGIIPCISKKTVSFLERCSHSSKDINIEDNLVLSSSPDEIHQSRLIPAGELYFVKD